MKKRTARIYSYASLALVLATIGLAMFGSAERRSFVKRRWQRLNPFADLQLAGQIREALARASSRPMEISVDVARGEVVLKGRVSKDELRSILAAVYGVPKVRGLIDRLEVQ